jgi:CRISPR-associated protein Cas5d
MKSYVIQLEIAGPMAMFARPDTGAAPTSYPVPTFSACKGIVESIAWLKSGAAWIRPTTVEVCRRVGTPGGSVRFQPYTTNYGGPLRKPNQVRQGSSLQLFATVLVDVCYRVYGQIEMPEKSRDQVNWRHMLQDLFNRRVRQGRCFRTPCLGWSEFTANYWGTFRPEQYEVDCDLHLAIPAMLHSVWDAPQHGAYAPGFVQDVEVVKGVLKFA